MSSLPPEDIHLIEGALKQAGLTRTAVYQFLPRYNDWAVVVAQPHSTPLVLASYIDQCLYGEPFEAEGAVVYPLWGEADLLGALTAPSALPNTDFLPVLVTKCLENTVLKARRDRELRLTDVIRTIPHDADAQTIVDTLFNNYLGPDVRNCSILYYGPCRPERARGPFEYLEVVGSWVRDAGGGVGVGTRLYLEADPTVIEAIHSDGMLLSGTEEEKSLPPDPLMRALIRAQRISQWVALALHTDERYLGAFFVGTRRKSGFSEDELEDFHLLRKYLTLHTLVQTMRRELANEDYGRTALLNAVTDGIIILIPNGPSVFSVNAPFNQMFIPDPFEVYSMHPDDLVRAMQIPESAREQLMETWNRFPFREAQIYSGEFNMMHTEGYPMEISWRNAPVVNSDGTVSSRLVTFRDLSSERAAVQVRSAFLQRISHELRTPLTSISGFAEFILEVEGDDLPDLAREYTEIILTSARRLKRLFNDIIDLTRASAGEVKLQMMAAHLPDMVIDVIAQLEMVHKGRNQSVLMDVDDDLPPVYIDVDRVVQVLTNLIANAIKYGPEDSTIHVDAFYAGVREDLPVGAPEDVVLPCAVVRVCDEGQGLAPSEIAAVFEPFYRTSEARQAQIEGAGLGLAVSQSFVELHRGHIWAIPNTVVQGGQFVFTLPTMHARES